VTGDAGRVSGIVHSRLSTSFSDLSVSVTQFSFDFTSGQAAFGPNSQVEVSAGTAMLTLGTAGGGGGIGGSATAILAMVCLGAADPRRSAMPTA
jgi:hypothetical protein